MKQYGKIMIAEVGKYLISSSGKRAFALPLEEVSTEAELSNEVVLRPDKSVSFGGVFNTRPSSDLKKKIIQMIWSNDDQIAIILNKDDGTENKKMYQFMQEWRKFAGSIANAINNKRKDDEHNA